MKKQEAERLINNLLSLLGCFREVNNTWDNKDAEMGKESYPFQNDFETQMMRVEEWVETFVDTIEEETEQKEVPITYGLIKNTVGWAKFAEVTGKRKNIHAIKAWGDYPDHKIFSITEEQAEKLGFI